MDSASSRFGQASDFLREGGAFRGIGAGAGAQSAATLGFAFQPGDSADILSDVAMSHVSQSSVEVPQLHMATGHHMQRPAAGPSGSPSAAQVGCSAEGSPVFARSPHVAGPPSLGMSPESNGPGRAQEHGTPTEPPCAQQPTQAAPQPLTSAPAASPPPAWTGPALANAKKQLISKVTQVLNDVTGKKSLVVTTRAFITSMDGKGFQDMVTTEGLSESVDTLEQDRGKLEELHKDTQPCPAGTFSKHQEEAAQHAKRVNSERALCDQPPFQFATLSGFAASRELPSNSMTMRLFCDLVWPS